MRQPDMRGGAALLFDLDGTLIHSDPLHAAIFVDMLRARGIDVGPDAYERDMHGRLTQEIFAEYLPGQDAQRLTEEKEAEFRRRLSASTGDQAVPGAADFVRRGRAMGFRTAVVTNAPGPNAPLTLEVLGLRDAFDFIVRAEDCAFGKPDPAPYRAALDRLGLRPSAAIAFEDSPSGVTSAVTAGLRTVGIATTSPASALAVHGADPVFSDFTEAALGDFLALHQGALT